MKPSVLITGSAGGIGRAAAELFKKRGWTVFGVDRKPVIHGDLVDKFINEDVSDPDAVLKIASEVSERTDRLDVLVNNAAIQICKPLLETAPSEWDEVMAINVRSCLLMVQAVFPLMKNHDASIINVSSVHSLATSNNIAAYAASKGALLALTRAMAIELSSYQIRVNAILPGAVDTAMLHEGLNRGHLGSENTGELLKELGSRSLLGRVGSPLEIAHAIVFLSDPKQSSFITGQTLIADGGVLCRLGSE
ncbi:SDR family oxidoreductase [uncultured Desulfosarcina sp.]|uniref:SDR family NAD(P)-dependent oxidoreductase n=1 Tax=uncultured Desulfosarcina sp. TaxID=218289 RepID=UPI0029C70BAC|nr:SDR family oxidoreductase [uncultured Desulfosarcina sp.]